MTMQTAVQTALETTAPQKEVAPAKEEEYSIGDAAALLNMPASTLRFYEKEGLLPGLERTSGGIRRFTETDLEWVRYIERLKMSGMPIKEIRRYVELFKEGDSTIAERRRIVEARRTAVEAQIRQLQDTLDFISYKCWFYEIAAETGTTDTPREMPFEELPPYIQEIKRKCEIRRY